MLAPLQLTSEEPLSLADAEVFRDLVQPIFESKCITCHQEGKIKGELRLDLLTGIQKGGKSGALFVAGKPETKGAKVSDLDKSKIKSYWKIEITLNSS